jgi:hypothetical protein
MSTIKIQQLFWIHFYYIPVYSNVIIILVKVILSHFIYSFPCDICDAERAIISRQPV